MRIFARAILKGLAIDLSNEIDRYAVPGRSGAALLSGPRRATFSKLTNRLVDCFGLDFGNQPLQRELLQVGQLDLGQHLKGHGVGQIRLAREDPLNLFFVLRKGDARLRSRALIALLDRFGACLLDGLFQDLRHQRTPVHLL